MLLALSGRGRIGGEMRRTLAPKIAFPKMRGSSFEASTVHLGANNPTRCKTPNVCWSATICLYSHWWKKTSGNTQTSLPMKWIHVSVVRQVSEEYRRRARQIMLDLSRQPKLEMRKLCQLRMALKVWENDHHLNPKVIVLRFATFECNASSIMTSNGFLPKAS